ncbi:MAG: wax ester/triacylglycerol synthase domain-containing protein, partial [Acidobacteriota bacterium]
LLYHERRENPFNLGGVSIFDGTIPAAELIALLEARLDLIPRYGQRLVREPLNLGHPVWEDDSRFNVREHVREHLLTPPGSEDQLRELAAVVMSERLDRSKPLWDLTVVQGLPGGQTALITRIHHCMVDGVAGVELMKILLDQSSESAIDRQPTPTRRSVREQSAADPGRRIFDAVLGGMEELMNRALDINDTLLNLAESAISGRAQELPPDPAPQVTVPLAPVEPLPFNGPLSGEHEFNWLKIPMAEARAIRAALRGSINDVILTIIGGAITSYLLEIGQSIAGRRSRVMVPVNVRANRTSGTVGNGISFLPVEVPLDLMEPRRLFAAISRQTSFMKQNRLAEMVNLLISGYGALPAPIQAAVGATIPSRILPFNLISTNVPGPPLPLFTLGRRLLAH